MQRLSVLSAFAVAVVSGFATGAFGVGESAAPAGRIVFARSDARGHPNVYVVEADGSGMRRLIPNASQPSVSPDGRRIAFTRTKADRQVIWIARVDGSHSRPLTHGRPGRLDSWAAWAPDSHTLFFSRFAKGTVSASIFAIRDTGKGLEELTHAPPIAGGDYGTCLVRPAPSPKGDVVTYIDTPVNTPCHGPGGYYSLLKAVRTSGKKAILPFRFPRPTYANDVFIWDAGWSPDGRMLAYSLTTDATAAEGDRRADGIYISSVGTRPTRIAHHGDEPSFSPDGTWLAFVDDGKIWLTRTNARGQRRVTDGGGTDSTPAWIPSRTIP